MNDSKKVNLLLTLAFLFLETFFIYFVLTKGSARAALIGIQPLLNRGVDIFVLSTVLSVIFAFALLLLQYAIGRLLIRMFFSGKPDFFCYILPRDCAIAVNILLFCYLSINNQILFSIIVLFSKIFTSILFYKKVKSLAQAFVFGIPIYADALISILLSLN